MLERIKIILSENKITLIILAILFALFLLSMTLAPETAEAAEIMQNILETEHVLHELHTIQFSTQTALVDEGDITNLMESIIPLQEFILLQIIAQNNANEPQLSYRHWMLAMNALQAGLIVALIFASIWGRK
jgi:MarR-like DNA-binding transcriptional regulator SgrR of sgrS sRNA